MNAKTLEAVTRHGNALLAAFPNATERDPVAVCKKLRRIEAVAHRGATDYCNGDPCHAITGKTFRFGDNETDWGDFTAIILSRVARILGEEDCERAGVHVNGDARGYALKTSSEWARSWNYSRAGLPQIHTDWGGYGILAPDLTA